ncbi:hypothetical protein IC607_02690 [Cellulomonas sp. JH27-2]|uniref:hypothetical protein n=1 Tax=Cellulomonas sp. JH27-2 TaxID=2774139 RepID=UPI0017853537|nr:hypothetical protein [Cellulomonas sp. JH27-2]MBD8057870.1 hypothetical protein [Cellulomonas sp. JH27-2]
MALQLIDVLQAPELAAGVLQDTIPGCSVDRVFVAHGHIVFNLTFAPLRDLPAYPDERARVVVASSGDVTAFPIGAPRPWLHRSPNLDGTTFGAKYAGLCLFYPLDRRELTWQWDDGFEDYVLCVQRHLAFEEYWRRHGEWPVEDAPHGNPPRGQHPILTPFMRKEAARWARLKKL